MYNVLVKSSFIMFSLVLVACQPHTKPKIDVDKINYLAHSNSNLTLTLISDLECSSCKRFKEKYLARLLSQYVDLKKVNFQSELIPFLGDKSFEKAALLKLVEQDNPTQYIKAYELAYKQEVFGQDVAVYFNALVNAGILQGTNIEIEKKIESARIREKLTAVKERLIESGVRSVPAIFLNGEKVEFNGLDELMRKIDKDLNFGDDLKND